MANDNNGGIPQQQRRPYSPPVLEEYGSVANVTLGVGSANGDAGQGMMP